MGPSVKGVSMTFHIPDCSGAGGSVALMGHTASAAGDIHSSRREPPKEVEMRPCGTPSSSYTPRNVNQQTAER
jgi:hypothetical protein